MTVLTTILNGSSGKDVRDTINQLLSTVATLTASLLPSGYDVIVLGGQSNMVSRGTGIDATLDATDPRIFQYGFDSQTVTLASNPLDHQDEGANTVGMGLTFAKAYLADLASKGITNRKVLLVPCAKGGTAFNTGFWRAGGGGDAPAIARTNAAMAQGTGTNKLVAILWHQGESDATVLTQAQYTADLDALIARWRSSMSGASATTPFVCGGFFNSASFNDPAAIPQRNIASRVSYTGYANSLSLVDIGDGLHFNAASQRTLGSRYFAAYQSALTNVVAPTGPTLNALTVSPNTATVGTAYTGTVTGLTSGSTPSLTGAGAAGLGVSGASITGTPTTAGAVNVVETLAGATNSGRSSSAITVTAAASAGTNLLTAPQDFSAWPGSGEVNVTVNVGTNPVSGLSNADRITQATGTNPHGMTTPASQGALTSGQVYTYAFDVKSETQQYVQLHTSGSFSSGFVNFDIIAGTVVGGSGWTSSVTDLGGGWKRIAGTFTSGASAAFAGRIAMPLTATTARATSETVASGSEKSLLVCNAQLVAGSVANAF